MTSLANKRILLGVTGGIAAYKSAELVRRLRDRGADVRAVMTRSAQEFITPLTLQALSGKPVHLDLWDREAEAAMGHIELARWADLVLVAPASADFLARLAQGRADDLLATLCLATDARIVVAPAMNQLMWQNVATRDNVSLLRRRGLQVLGPGEGDQACGEVGPGRMLDVPDLLEGIEALFGGGPLVGRKVVITAGPTREALDPVRYLSNYSSGRMGYALAEAAAAAGAQVELISGPTALSAPPGIQVIPVTTAEQMCSESLARAVDCHIFVAAAAVADYRPRQSAQEKIKKRDAEAQKLDLIKNPDIVSEVAALSTKPLVVGFAAETENLLGNAREKLQRKGLDLVIANDVSDRDIGFNSEQNAVTLVWPDREEELARRGKRQLAGDLIARIADALESPGEA